MRVAMHELKAGLSRYVAQARAGTVVEITSHDRPVARLVGIPAAAHGGVQRLLASGAARWTGGRPAAFEPVRVPGTGLSVAQAVIEDRG